MIRPLALALLWPALALAEAPLATAPGDPYRPAREVMGEIQKIVTPNGVQETFTATLGGVPQVVNVRGADRDNPILLFIHGGPGAVEMPIGWAFQRPWEDYFTVVQWDQRAAGRSYRLSDPEKVAPTLTPDRYRDDAIELIELLRKKYGKRKIFVLGHSWGSTIGLSVAAKRPDLLYAYVGMGQLIDFRENERVGLAWTVDQARKDHNATALAELEAIKPYPGIGPLDVAKTDIERKWNIHYGGLAAFRQDGDFYFHAPRLSPEYTPDDIRAWDAGSALTMKTMWPQLADLSFTRLTKVDCPVIFFLGRYDYTTPWPIAEAWFKRLHAPAKRIVWFEKSAHLMNMEEPGRVFAALVQDVRPLAGKDAR